MVRRQVLGSASTETPVYHHTELILVTFSYVRSMKLSVKKLTQAAIKLPRAGDHTRGHKRVGKLVENVYKSLLFHSVTQLTFVQP